MSLTMQSSSATNNTPLIGIDLLLSPQTHCFTRQSAPSITLKLTLLSPPSPRAGAITLYTEQTPLNIRYALSHRGFTIRDLTTGQDLTNTTFINNAQRMACPRLRVRGCAEEPYFLTLHAPPSTPSSTEAQKPEIVELSGPFGRQGFRPQPWSIVQLGHEIDEAGNPRNIRRSRSVTGVDGLEPGHEYEVSLNVEELRRSVMWAPVPKEDILLESGYRGPGRNLEDYAWIRDRPLNFRVGTVRVRILDEEEQDNIK
ncbi:hypothetical protein GGS26DRAFT_598016 [Hypomontagnella submonticulosa]|nr:hypothetical protein GGS26DRAFT_598016 [Hypomontagnella submonticulosa]